MTHSLQFPYRVCLCNSKGLPSCTDINSIFVNVSPGETTEIPVVLVGSDFGTTIGSIYANTLSKTSQVHFNMHNPNGFFYPVKESKRCTMLKLNVEVSNTYQVVY